MLSLFIFAFLLASASALNITWSDYKSLFPFITINKNSEFHFLDNIKYIIEHNSKSSSYKLGLTPFLHLSASEWKNRFYNITPEEHSNVFTGFSLRGPQSFSWVEQGKTTPVKDQSNCGSCWAFSTTETVETAWAIKSGEIKILSPQQLVDCSKLNSGCNGGLQSRAYRYLESNKQCLEQDYVYTAKDGSCHSCSGAVDTLKSYVSVKDENSMLQAILVTSLGVAIQADQREFQMYKSGVLDFECGTDLDHAVTVEGYGTEDGKDYWLVRNSWGSSWGENGYIKMARGKNLCGISQSVVYPIF